mgnify:CR=1 FL=1
MKKNRLGAGFFDKLTRDRVCVLATKISKRGAKPMRPRSPPKLTDCQGIEISIYVAQLLPVKPVPSPQAVSLSGSHCKPDARSVMSLPVNT